MTVKYQGGLAVEKYGPTSSTNLCLWLNPILRCDILSQGHHDSFQFLTKKNKLILTMVIMTFAASKASPLTVIPL